MLKVITDGSNVILPDYVWWQMLTPPPRVSIKNLSGVDIIVSGVIDGGTSLIISTGNAVEFQTGPGVTGWVVT